MTGELAPAKKIKYHVVLRRSREANAVNLMYSCVILDGLALAFLWNLYKSRPKR